MAWHWTGNKPLSEPIMIRFTDSYMLHWEDELMWCNWRSLRAKYAIISIVSIHSENMLTKIDYPPVSTLPSDTIFQEFIQYVIKNLFDATSSETQ